MISSKHLGFEFGHSFFFSEIFRQMVLHTVLVNVFKEGKKFMLSKNTLEILEGPKFGPISDGRVLGHSQQFREIIVIRLEKVGIVSDAIV